MKAYQLNSISVIVEGEYYDIPLENGEHNIPEAIEQWIEENLESVPEKDPDAEFQAGKDME